ncbi:PREDICTED: uncharacterized protein LOC105951551 [Erythranthe guttata]|nr:PREDICTED: uncharacterized protein LOC105951551 [Erythranthe guttata]|eukprot:XP_012830460.1 PREDICTED: uncharacterized protein LOC105951551 [Erythranthe guttata]
MASSSPFFYCNSPQFLDHRNINSTNNNNLTSSSSSNSCSPSPYSSYPSNFCNRRRRSKIIWKHKSIRAEAMSTSNGNLSSQRGIVDFEDEPDHLLVLVHGILASPSDWTYFESELKRRLGKKFLIYASSCNMYTKTFTGIDGAGKRLADEVVQVVKKTESLKKISFLAHSLGGLFARNAISVLYSPNVSANKGLIAGLEAINFITLATPHLGVRGNRQLPFLLGVSFLEKLAAPIAPVFTGRTGSQLFLTDGKPNKPPLLLRMASDCEDGKFISALGAFKCRVLYANVSYDHMVGWRTSSIRRENELFKVSNSYYDRAPANTVQYHEIIEEEMIHGLQRLGWKKVDVSFHSAFWPFFAHNNIHVKNEWFHNAGAGVVAHVADTIKQQDSYSTYISASL